MIIAAYAGTGKSTFAQRVEGAVDLPIMPHSWVLPPTEKTGVELEGEKGALHRLSHPLFPDNYLAEILKAERDCRFVLIPTNLEVIRRLREDYGRTVLLCYPDDGCREEYRARFLARGNSESFLELFVDGWDHFLNPVRDYGQGTHIVMSPGEYLTDLLQRFEDARRADTAQPIGDETIRGIEKKLSELKMELVLYLSGDDGCCFYPIKDLDAPEERKFLDQVGRMLLEEDAALVPLIAPKKTFKAEPIKAFSTEDREAVTAFVKKHIESFSAPLKGSLPRWAD